MRIGFHANYLLFLQDFNEILIFRQIFEKYSNTKFHENSNTKFHENSNTKFHEVRILYFMNFEY